MADAGGPAAAYLRAAPEVRVTVLDGFRCTAFCPVGRVLVVVAEGGAAGEAFAIQPPPPGSSAYLVEQAGRRYVFPALTRAQAAAFAAERAAQGGPPGAPPEGFRAAAAGLGALPACRAMADAPWVRAFEREVRAYGVLRRAGAPAHLAERILHDTMGAPWEALVADPYGLLDGEVGSLRAIDAMALALGHLPGAPERADAWVGAALAGWDEAGALCGKAVDDLWRPMAAHGFARADVEAAVRRAAEAELCRWDGSLLWGWSGWEADAQVIDQLGRLRSEAAGRRRDRRTRMSQDGLSAAQREAVGMANRHPVSILTGGPGVGKTTVIRHMAEQSAAAGKVFLCAPTGRAAQRLEEACGRPAHTVHRLLKATAAGAFGHHADRPLPKADVYVDEASMLDRALCLSLLSALPDGARLILSGDPNQLPPVGDGNVLRDLIDCGAFPVTRLTEVFRQDAGSGVLELAERLRQGEAPWGLASPDLAWTELPAHLQASALEWAGSLAEGPPRQWFSARHEGAYGVRALNAAAQAALNPEGPSLPIGEGRRHVARVGDRVRQTRNNYRLGVMNGAIGRVVGVEGTALAVDWDGLERRHREDALAELDLAYATTVHAAQGSEFEHVGVVLPPDAGWSREHLYTAVTRARRTVRVHGSAAAFSQAAGSVAAPDATSLLPQLRAAVGALGPGPAGAGPGPGDA